MAREKTVVITGGAGAIRSNLANYLLEQQYEVIVIDDLSSGSLNNLMQTEKLHFFQKDVRDASILDHFSYECLKYECNLMEIDDKEYMQILDREKPDLLLVESAWSGNDGKWKDKIANLEVSKDKTLGLLVEECKARDIPTVFWNKEDPLFFSNFIEAAKFFDYVFTTDEGCIEKYREILKHDKIYDLPFAAQPRIHNPTYKYKIRLGRIAFAGTWYHIFPHRARDMEMLLDPALNYCEYSI